MKAPSDFRGFSRISQISQIFYVCVIVLLRFTQIFIRPKVLFNLSVEIIELCLVVVSFSP